MPVQSNKIVNTPQPSRPSAAAVVARSVPDVQRASVLKVSSPHDTAEVEAESTARKVTRMEVGDTEFRSAHVSRLERSRSLIRQPVVHRAAADPAPVSSTTATDIGNSSGSGSPLPAPVRRFMDPRFGADFGPVRIHTDERAARLSRQVNAQAFTVGSQVFFGRDRFQPDSSEGRELIAHELTHTIQQGAAIQRAADVTVAERSAPSVQRLGVSDALNYFADKANFIPGFRMLTVVLGVNPINMSPVERSAANVLRAAVEFMPGGALITQALDTYGVFDKVGAWVDQQIRSLGMAGRVFKDAIDRFIDSLSWSDILSLDSVWDRAKRIFTEPVDRLIAFVKSLVSGIIQFIKDAILTPIARLASETRGWDLLIAVLGKNPITGEPVPRTAETLIPGFLKLIGQEEVWENMKKSRAIPRAWAWFQGALTTVVGLVSQIPTLAINAFKSLEIVDIVLLPRAFAKVAAVFGNFLGSFITWAGQALWTLLEIIFDAVSPGAVQYIKKTGAALKSILQNPLPFIGNLVKAAKLGFQNFGANFGTHLKAGLIDWLTGSLPGVYIPKSFDLKEIVTFVFSVLGLTWQNIRQKLVKVLGETAVKVLETGFDIVVTLVTEGPAAAWDKIKEHLTNLKDMVIGAITDFVIDMVVKKAIPKLIAMFIPGAGFISAILSIYDTVMVFVNKISTIIQVVVGFIDSIVAIAGGAIAAAAAKVESILAKLLSLAINFFAGFIGLGKVADKIMGVIQKVRAVIDKAIDALIAWIVTMAKKLGKFVVQTGKKLLNWWASRKTFTAGGEPHALSFHGERDAARLFVASNELPVEDFLDLKAPECKGDKKKTAALNELRTQLQDVKVLIAKSKPGQDDEQLQKDIEKALNVMAPNLILLLSDTDWGTQANPAPLDYEKRRAAAYPTFYLGQGAAQTFTQQQMKDNYMKAPYKNSIKRYLPLQSEQTPGGEKTLGLVGSSQVDVGSKFEYQDKGIRGSEVENFKKIVIKYGMQPSNYDWDVDHVIELQIGGKDVFANLWPLPKGENRSSGSIIKHAETKEPGDKKITVQDAHDKKKKKGSQSIWLMITTTHQR
jgi:hypothetical protein